MIKPKNLTVSRIGSSGDVWLYLDARHLVELRPALARELTLELGDLLGLFVCDRSAVGEAAE
ncbi:hypothetical protein [Streptomyces sp. Da 82-17]|uniref:hypothetical protein n=1 Tax=Streptomyces sp. Da 82-17 TaxID=3377116 RepID=UPI0038D43774